MDNQSGAFNMSTTKSCAPTWWTDCHHDNNLDICSWNCSETDLWTLAKDRAGV
jgi:hypothetical protein